MKVIALARALFVALLATGARSYVLDDDESCTVLSNWVLCASLVEQDTCEANHDCTWDEDICETTEAARQALFDDFGDALSSAWTINGGLDCINAATEGDCTSGNSICAWGNDGDQDTCSLTQDELVQRFTASNVPKGVTALGSMHAYNQISCAPKVFASACENVEGCSWDSDAGECSLGTVFQFESYADDCGSDGDFDAAFAAWETFAMSDDRSCETLNIIYTCDSHETQASCEADSDCEYRSVEGACVPSDAAVERRWSRDHHVANTALDEQRGICAAITDRSSCTGDCVWGFDEQMQGTCLVSFAKTKALATAAGASRAIAAAVAIDNLGYVCDERTTEAGCNAVEGCERDGTDCVVSADFEDAQFASACPVSSADGVLGPPPPVSSVGNGTAGQPPPRVFADDESAAPAGSDRFAVAAALAAATLALTA